MLSKLRDPLLKPEEEYGLITSAQNGDLVALDKLVRCNIRLIIGIAKRHRGNGIPFQDLVQEGVLGFMKGIEKFDIKRGFKLSTYCTWWIRQAMTRALDDTSRTIRIPVHKLNESRIVRRFYRKYVEENSGKTPDSSDLEKLISDANRVDKKKRLEGLDKKAIEALGRLLHPLVYLDEPNSDDENLSLQDYLEAPDSDDPESKARSEERKTKCAEILSFLEPGERMFMMSKFGFFDKFRDKKEMAQFAKMPDAQVDFEINLILRKLRAECTKRGIDLQGLI